MRLWINPLIVVWCLVVFIVLFEVIIDLVCIRNQMVFPAHPATYQRSSASHGLPANRFVFIIECIRCFFKTISHKASSKFCKFFVTTAEQAIHRAKLVIFQSTLRAVPIFVSPIHSFSANVFGSFHPSTKTMFGYHRLSHIRAEHSVCFIESWTKPKREKVWLVLGKSY